MPKGNRTKREVDPLCIKDQDDLFQCALGFSTEGYGINESGRPCTVGVSTWPGTRHPKKYDVARAPESRGFGRDNISVRGRPKTAVWTGGDDSDDS